MAISSKDSEIVRALAERLAEAAADPAQETKLAEWKRHNSLKPGKPMVLQAPEHVWEEFVPVNALRCESDISRKVERALRRRLFKVHHLRDDEPITAEFPVRLHIQDSGWEIQMDQERNPDFQGVHGAVHYNTVIEDDADVEDIIPLRKVSVDWESSRREYEQVTELIGDILNVKMQGRKRFWFAPMDTFGMWRGMGQIMYDMIDRPEWVHRALNRITESEIGVARQLETADALSLNNDVSYVGSGGIGATDELPPEGFDGGHVQLKDLWGFATTQIFSEVSPAMHDEFAITYEKRYLEMFRLNCYGCCEPLHKKMHLVRKLPRMRRVSMSPWVNVEEGAEQIGRDFIYSSKPNPAFLAAGTWDITPCRNEIIAVLQAARKNHCITEFIMKDTHTCCGEPQRYTEWTEMAMQLAEDYVA